ncbi:fungal-specific transcription factor domain-containing protein [Sparassis latifolia]|uniref:Zn(2)-C6 fungal-type domain-containing protein n=1 Tax=Sparassis crispa TaxID=139825 RepID=A0A401GAU1_9APHY|nr:hypothetical protein SCP_0204590 [Sparassis crispa]GBE79261.1 hypothetical protein SCP_0204590 [Sparassis crispa]
MTEAVAPSDPNDNPPMTHQSKKKRVEDQPLSPDIGLKPVQLQRRRVWRACESCRRKKIKCDGNEPTCSQCAASKSQCTWLQTKDRAALSRHYVQELEARLLHMESLFHQVAPILEQVGEASGLDLSCLPPSIAPSQSGAPTIPLNVLQSVLPKVKEVAQNSAAADGSAADTPIKVEDDVSESFGQLALDEHGHMHWIGGSSTMSLIQSFRAMTSSPLHRVSPMEEDPLAPGPSVNKLYFPASVFFGKVHALPRPEEVEYPDRDLADKLVDAYFAKFHFLMPVIDKPSFVLKYKYLMEHTNDPLLARTQTAFIALVCAVFAVAARFVDDPRLSKFENLDAAGMGMVYYERALILHYISHASTQIEHVQCFLLLSSFLCSVNCLPQAWLLVGQAVRAAQDIGLHRSPRRLLIKPIEKETRRKIWWGVYTLDRMLALALGRPLAIEDADCDVELPVDIDDDHLPDYFAGAQMSRLSPSLMKGFIELTLLYRIGGQVLRQVYALDKCRDHLEPEKRAELSRAVDTLDKRLIKWCDDLPAAFKSRPVNEREVSMGAVLCSHYYSILTTLHRNFLPLKRDQPVSPRSTAKAVSTARACIRLAPSIKSVVPPSHHLAFFIQNLFSSAVIILLYAMHSVDPAASTAAMDEVANCLSVLGSWEGHWPGARKCKELLEDLAATAREAIKTSASGQSRGAGSGSSSSASPSSVMSDGWPPGQIPLPVPERLMKHRRRRNSSRDVRDLRLSSPHQSSSAMQFRSDSQRARSTSRKRPHDDDGLDGSAYVLPSSYPGRSSFFSAHSSPASVNSQPSPSGATVDFPQDPSPRIVASNSYGSLNPTSPSVATPSQPRFDYDFTQDRWGVQAGEANGLKFFPSGAGAGAQNTYPAFAPPPPQSPADPAFGYTYDANGADPAMGVFGLSGTPPSSGFAAPGLPFRGLDYIRNFNPGYSNGEQDQLWHTFDPGAFGYDPEIPFTLGDIPAEGRWPDVQ